MKITRITLLLMVATFATLVSCKKPEGEGGNCTINGTVWMQDYNSTFTVLEAEYAATDEWVYIIYGDEVNYGDRVRTNYKGEFEFKYLRQGNYKVYVYSKDSTLQSPSGQTAMVKEVNLNKNKQTLSLDVITIFK